MWFMLFLCVVVICFTVDNMFENYLNKKYPTRYDRGDDDAEEG